MARLKAEYKTVKLFQDIAHILKPPPKLLVADWADRYRRLPSESSPEPGQWRTSRAEYQREIMNAVNDPAIENISIKSSAQVGKSEIVLNIAGYFIDYEPSSIMLIQPTVDMGESFSKDRLAPMIRDTPVLREKIKDAKSRDSENTIMHKKFPGGHITIAGSNSPASLASRPIRILLCDETDRYPPSAGSEGDPIKLAEKRTNNYWNRKKVKVSTPTVAGASAIDTEFKKGTQEEWCVRCPDCGTYQPYEFKRVQFKSVTMRCFHCGAELTETEWKEQPHKWIAFNDKPERRSRSFHLNELASPWRHWDEIIEEYREAKRDVKERGLTNKLQVFYNTVLGEVWEEQGDTVDHHALLKRCEEYEAEIPDDVVLITAGVDVQDKRLEIERVGWKEGGESWGIWKDVLYGDTALDQVWEDLEALLNVELHYQNGNSLNVAAACIDTGGHNTNRVYKFLKKMQKKGKRIYGVKGYAREVGIPFIYRKTDVVIKDIRGNVVDKTYIYIIGVNAGKEDIIARLKIEKPGPGYCHFPKGRGYDQKYMEGLTSESKLTELVNGRTKIKWVKKKGVANEPLDIRNYAYAAEQLLKPNYQVLKEKIDSGINYMKSSGKKKRKRKPGVVSRGIEV